MVAELDDIKRFVAVCSPFDELSDELLEQAVIDISISYETSGSHIDLDAESSRSLYIVRSGSVEVRDADDQLIDRVSEGGYFGFPSMLTGGPIVNKITVMEDALLYLVNETAFNSLRKQSRNFDRFFNRAHAKRLRQAMRTREFNYRLTEKVRDMMTENPLRLEASKSIYDAAELMRDSRVSSVLIFEGNRLQGILTDKDLRNRVLAERVDPTACVVDVMTQNPISVKESQYAYEAQLMMMDFNIHHLPVMSATDDGVVGIVSATDFIRAQNNDPLFLISSVNRANTVDELAVESKKIPSLMDNLVAADARADEIGRILTSITDAITRRLIKLAEAEYGDAPVAFAWAAFGSQARQDQVLGSDQDNGLILSEDFNESHANYFEKLSKFVCDGLNACGNVYCPGDIMAMNPKWRQPVTHWEHYFSKWVAEPSPMAVMQVSIFFDLRCIAGEPKLVDRVKTHFLKAAKGNHIFLKNLAENALGHAPPLGFFKQFVLEKDGDHGHSLDLKKRGTIPIVDVARIYALSTNIEAVNTQDRLKALMGTDALVRKDIRDLMDAHEFIAHLRLVNQRQQMIDGKKVSNKLDPETLSSLVRHQLKDAFSVVRRSQSGVQMRFMGGAL